MNESPSDRLCPVTHYTVQASAALNAAALQTHHTEQRIGKRERNSCKQGTEKVFNVEARDHKSNQAQHEGINNKSKQTQRKNIKGQRKEADNGTEDAVNQAQGDGHQDCGPKAIEMEAWEVLAGQEEEQRC